MPDQMKHNEKAASKDAAFLFLILIFWVDIDNLLGRMDLSSEAVIEAAQLGRMIFATAIVFGSIIVAFYGVADFAFTTDAGVLKIEATDFEYKRVKKIQNLDNDYSEFKEDAKSVECIDHIIEFGCT